MPDAGNRRGASIPQDVMLARLTQSEQMREFFIQMWLQNPSLAAQAGERVRGILAPVPVCCEDGTFPARPGAAGVQNDTAKLRSM